MKMKKGSKPGDMISKMNEKKGKMKEKKGAKNWIAGAIKKPGALHAELGIKKGHKIPAGTLKSAAGKGGKLGARARLAETLKGFKHKKGAKNDHDADDKKTAMKMCKMCGKKHMAGKHMKKHGKK